MPPGPGLTACPAGYSLRLSKWCLVGEDAGVHSKLDGLGRFAEPWLLILTSLADGPKHGYAIMTDVAAFSGVRMEPGTLCRALSRLERRGWVRTLAAVERRRWYEIAATWPYRAGQGDAAGCARRPGSAVRGRRS